MLASAKAAVHQSDIYHQFFGRPLSPDFSNFFSHDSPILWQSCTHTWKEKLVLMPIRVVAVVFTTLQSAVLGTNYSSVAVKLLYVSIIPVFVSERFFKQERNLIHSCFTWRSIRSKFCITFIFLSSFFCLTFVFFHLLFSYFYSTMDWFHSVKLEIPYYVYFVHLHYI